MIIPRCMLLLLVTLLGSLATNAVAGEHEFQFANGSSWRGEDGAEVTVVFVENGVEQTMTGNVMKVDGRTPYRLVAVRGEVARKAPVRPGRTFVSRGSPDGDFFAQGSELSSQPRGNPLYPMPTITSSAPTMQAPTCLFGSLDRCADRKAMPMK